MPRTVPANVILATFACADDFVYESGYILLSMVLTGPMIYPHGQHSCLQACRDGVHEGGRIGSWCSGASYIVKIPITKQPSTTSNHRPEPFPPPFLCLRNAAVTLDISFARVVCFNRGFRSRSHNDVVYQESYVSSSSRPKVTIMEIELWSRISNVEAQPDPTAIAQTIYSFATKTLSRIPCHGRPGDRFH